MCKFSLIIGVCFILSCESEKIKYEKTYKIFLNKLEKNQLLDCIGSDINERFLLMIKIGGNSCVSCIAEVFVWNELASNKNLKLLGVLENVSILEDVPLSYKFNFDTVLQDSCMFDFPIVGDIQKMLIDMNNNRIMFVDFNHTSKTAHLAFKSTINALVSYP